MDKALITGASGGIGYELAKIMASNGHDLVITARNKNSLSKVKKELEDDYDIKVKVLTSDLSKPGSAEKLYKALNKEKIGILVNNAGAGLKGSFVKTKLEENQDIAHLNMNSLMELTHLFGKDFVNNKKGRVLNIASIAAFLPGPKQPVYYATKAFVRSFSRGLAESLKGTGVTVTVLNPGVTKTNFFNAAKAPSVTGGASAEGVARLGYEAMMQGKTEVTHGLYNKILTNIAVRLIPYSLQARLVNRASDV